MTGATQTTAISNEIAPVVAAFQQQLGHNLIGIILFGSRSWGDARPESDWDLLSQNICQHQYGRERHQNLLACLLATWRGRVTVIAKTPAEFTSYLAPLYLDIALDGMVPYDRDGWLTSRLAAIRTLIDRHGLYRIQRGRDLIWEWLDFPGFG